jgi:hypothetical protein
MLSLGQPGLDGEAWEKTHAHCALAQAFADPPPDVIGIMTDYAFGIYPTQSLTEFALNLSRYSDDASAF